MLRKTNMHAATKRLLSVVLTLTILFGVAPLTTRAAMNPNIFAHAENGIYTSQMVVSGANQGTVGNIETGVTIAFGTLDNGAGWPGLNYVPISVGFYPEDATEDHPYYFGYMVDSDSISYWINPEDPAYCIVSEIDMTSNWDYSNRGALPAGRYRAVVWGWNASTETEIARYSSAFEVTGGGGVSWTYDMSDTTLTVTGGGAINEPTQLKLHLDFGVNGTVSLASEDSLYLDFFSAGDSSAPIDLSNAVLTSPAEFGVRDNTNPGHAVTSMEIYPKSIYSIPPAGIDIIIDGALPIAARSEVIMKLFRDPGPPADPVPLGHWEGGITFTASSEPSILASVLTAPAGVMVGDTTALDMTLKSNVNVAVAAGDRLTLLSSGISLSDASIPADYTVTEKTAGLLTFTFNSATTITPDGIVIPIGDCVPSQTRASVSATLTRVGNPDMQKFFDELVFSTTGSLLYGASVTATDPRFGAVSDYSIRLTSGSPVSVFPGDSVELTVDNESSGKADFTDAAPVGAGISVTSGTLGRVTLTFTQTAEITPTGLTVTLSGVQNPPLQTLAWTVPSTVKLSLRGNSVNPYMPLPGVNYMVDLSETTVTVSNEVVGSTSSYEVEFKPVPDFDLDISGFQVSMTVPGSGAFDDRSVSVGHKMQTTDGKTVVTSSKWQGDGWTGTYSYFVPSGRILNNATMSLGLKNPMTPTVNVMVRLTNRMGNVAGEAVIPVELDTDARLRVDTNPLSVSPNIAGTVTGYHYLWGEVTDASGKIIKGTHSPIEITVTSDLPQGEKLLINGIESPIAAYFSGMGTAVINVSNVRTASGTIPTGVTNVVCTLRWGDQSDEVHMVVNWPNRFEIKGRVLSPAGSPETNAVIFNGEYRTKVRADGTFSMYTEQLPANYKFTVTSMGISQDVVVNSADYNLVGDTCTLKSDIVFSRPPIFPIEVLHKGIVGDPDATKPAANLPVIYIEYEGKMYHILYQETRGGVEHFLFDAPDAAYRGGGTMVIDTERIQINVSATRDVADKISVTFEVPASVFSNVGFRYYVMGIYNASGNIVGKHKGRDYLPAISFGRNHQYGFGRYTLVFMDGNLADVMPNTLEAYARYGLLEGIAYVKYEYEALPGASYSYVIELPIVPSIDDTFRIDRSETRLTVTNTLPAAEGAVSLAARVVLATGWPKLRLAFSLPQGATIPAGEAFVYYKGKAVGTIVPDGTRRYVADMTFDEGLPANAPIDFCFAVNKSAGQSGEIMAELGFPTDGNTFFWAPIGYAGLSVDAITLYGATASSGNSVSLVGMTTPETDVTINSSIVMEDGEIFAFSKNAVSNKLGRYTAEIVLPHGHALKPLYGLAFTAEAVVNGVTVVSAPFDVTYCLPDDDLVEKLIIKHYGQTVELIGPNVKPGKLSFAYWGNRQGTVTAEVTMGCPPEKLKIVQLVMEEARPGKEPHIMVLDYDEASGLWTGSEMLHPDFYPAKYNVAYDIREGTLPMDLVWDSQSMTVLENGIPASYGIEDIDAEDAVAAFGDVRSTVESAVADKYGAIGYFEGRAFTGGDSGVSAVGTEISVVHDLDFGNGPIQSRADLEKNGFIAINSTDGNTLYEKAYLDMEKDMANGSTRRISLDLTGTDSWDNVPDLQDFINAPGSEVRVRVSSYSVLAIPDAASPTGFSFAPANTAGNIITQESLSSAIETRMMAITPGGTVGNADYEESMFWMQEWNAIYWSPLDPKGTAPPPGMSASDVKAVNDIMKGGLSTGNAFVDEVFKQSAFFAVDLLKNVSVGGALSIVSTLGDLPTLHTNWNNIITNLETERDQLMSIMFEPKGFYSDGSPRYDTSKFSVRFEALQNFQKEQLRAITSDLNSHINDARSILFGLELAAGGSIILTGSAMASIGASGGTATPVVVGMLGSSSIISIIAAHANATQQNKYNDLLSQFAGYRQYLKSYIASHTKKQEQEITEKYDPSGFVYSGTEDNKLADVTMTIWVADDEHGTNAKIWDEAEEYGEINPQMSNQVGYYAWAVPMGWWQVRAEKAGYSPGISDWMPVVPEQLGVNIEMVPVGGYRYTFTVAAGAGGSVSGTQSGSYAPDTAVSVTAAAAAGYVFDRWTVTGVTLENAGASTVNFAMPNKEVTLTANFAYVGVIDNDNGTIGQQPTKKPDVTEEKPVNPFADVTESAWYYENVLYVYTHQLFNGMTENMFGPSIPMSRGMLVTVLGRHYGVDISQYGSASFDDVDGGKYYAPYVEWARQVGIVSGVGGNLFDPDANVTRQDLAVILMRYAEYAGLELPVKNEYSEFMDDADIANYAKEAIEAFFKAGIIRGYPDGSFKPKGTATRAEVASILHRFLEAVIKKNP